MKLLVLVAALVLVPAAAAAPKSPSGTIAINEAAPYAFGDPITFTVTTANLKGNQYPLVYVACSSVVDGELLYGQLAHPYETFVLGGGSSPWHLDRDDVNCLAHLYAYGGKEKGFDVIVELADPVTFFAEG